MIGRRGALRRVRVLHVITLLELGGAQQNTLHTVRHLDRGRFDVALATGRGGMLDDEAASIDDLELVFADNLVRKIAPIRDLEATAELVRHCRSFRPDIVHTHSSKAGILGRIASRISGVPIVVHSIHGFGFTPGQAAPIRAAYVAAERVCAPLTSHFVVVSRSNLTEGVRVGLFRREQASLIRSGFPVASFQAAGDAAADARASVRRELGLDPDCPLVASIACLKPQKDPMTWAEVVARVSRIEPTTRFLMAGDGQLRGQLTERLKQLGVAPSVRLLGWRDDVPRLLAASDLLLHTSRWEGLPRVLPQSMAVGIPVVATEVDGAPEAVTHRSTGLLCAPCDVVALADAVVELVRDPALRRRMGAASRLSVDEFDDRHLVPQQERLYDRLLSRCGLP